MIVLRIRCEELTPPKILLLHDIFPFLDLTGSCSLCLFSKGFPFLVEFFFRRNQDVPERFYDHLAGIVANGVLHSLEAELGVQSFRVGPFAIVQVLEDAFREVLAIPFQKLVALSVNEEPSEFVCHPTCLLLASEKIPFIETYKNQEHLGCLHKCQ